VAFAHHEDGGILDLDAEALAALSGAVSVQVTDGLPRAGTPDLAIRDEILFTRTVPPSDLPVEGVALRLRHAGADGWVGTGLPADLASERFAEMHLIFSIRRDAVGDRPRAAGTGVDLLGLVRFEIVGIRRID
jgi:hypothetical protein